MNEVVPASAKAKFGTLSGVAVMVDADGSAVGM